MKRLLSFLLLLFALPLAAQTVQNPSFEATTNFPYSFAGVYALPPIPNWTATGSVCIWQPSSAEFTKLSDGPTSICVGPGSVSQDLGAPPTPGATYTLTVAVGQRLDGLNANYTLELDAGTTKLCSTTASNKQIPTGTFQDEVLTCPISGSPTGDLTIVLSADARQVEFDNVRLTSVSNTPPPNIVTFQFIGQLIACSKCDGTDDQGPGALGLLASSTVTLMSGSATLCSATLNSNAQFSCSAGINIAPAFVPLSATLTPPSSSSASPVTNSQLLTGILFVGRSNIIFSALFDAANLQPRGLRFFTQ